MTTTSAPGGPAPDGDAPRGNLTLGIVAGVAVGLVALVLAWWALQDPITAEPSPTTPTPTVSTPAASPSGTPTPTQSPSPTPSPTPEESATPTPGESATPTPNPAVVTELPAGSWITVLDSLRQSSVSVEDAIARAREISPAGYTAVVIDTNAFPNLNRGYWAIVIPGQSSREEVNAICQEIGIGLGDDCYPRQITG